MGNLIVKEDVVYSTTNYPNLNNKPSINMVPLVGKLTLSDIDTYSKEEVDQMVSGVGDIKIVPEKPGVLNAIEGTMYHVGTASPYDMYFYYKDDEGIMREKYLGKTNNDYSEYQTKVSKDLQTESDTVVGAINELWETKMGSGDPNFNTTYSHATIDCINETYDVINPKQNAFDPDLNTPSKIVVDAINSLYEGVALEVGDCLVLDKATNKVGHKAIYDFTGTKVICNPSSDTALELKSVAYLTFDRAGHIIEYDTHDYKINKPLKGVFAYMDSSDGIISDKESLPFLFMYVPDSTPDTPAGIAKYLYSVGLKDTTHCVPCGHRYIKAAYGNSSGNLVIYCKKSSSSNWNWITLSSPKFTVKSVHAFI